MKIKYPIEHGIVQDWDAMKLIWKYIYSKEQLHVQPEGSIFPRNLIFRASCAHYGGSFEPSSQPGTNG
jgi:actin-related protein